MMKKFRYKVEKRTFVLLLMSVGIFISSWNGEYNGGDIALARFSYNSNHPIDIWGGFSLLFYGNIPNFFIPWGAWLYILQLSLVFTSLRILSKNLILNNKVVTGFWWLLCYSILVFSSYLTRDSTLFSFSFFGFCLIYKFNKSNKKNHMVYILGVLLMSVGFSFRPWLSIIPVLLLIFCNIKGVKLLVSALIVLTVPLIMDKTVYFNSKVNEVHPELQVVLLDAASITCLGNSKIPFEAGINLINLIGNTKYSQEQICGNFKPNSWQSLGAWGEDDSKKSNEILEQNNSSFNKIKLSTDKNLNSIKIEEIRSSWIMLIKNYPKEYMQIKLFQFGQLMLSGDTFGIRTFQEVNIVSKLQSILLIPYDIGISLHLFSPGAVIFFIALLLTYSFRQGKVLILPINLALLLPLLVLTFWVAFTAIAFIGDNGRYVYPASFFCFTLMLLWISQEKSYQIEK